MSWNECLKSGLELIGAGVILVFIILAWITFWEWIKDQISMAKYRHKWKHRFDKPPTAKCYCKDCDRYETNIEYCNKFSHYVGDNEFCSWANPRKHDPELKEKNNA